jgi:hypothetical protein
MKGEGEVNLKDFENRNEISRLLMMMTTNESLLVKVNAKVSSSRVKLKDLIEQ